MTRVSDEWLDDEVRKHVNNPHISRNYYAVVCELRKRRAADKAQPWVGVDLAKEPDRTETITIRLRERPEWLRQLLDRWENEARDYVNWGQDDDARGLRTRAQELRAAHNNRNDAEAERTDDLIVLDGQVEHQGVLIAELTERVVAMEKMWFTAIQNGYTGEPQAEPALPEWARQMDEMHATLLSPSATWRGKWRCEYDLGNEIMGFSRDTPQVAVAAAYRAYKEARGEVERCRLL